MNPNLTGWLGVTPLHRFARQDVDKAAIFMDRRQPPCAGRGVVHHAAWIRDRRRKAEHGRFLLRRGAQLTLPDDLAWATPIALATYRGHDAIVGVLKACEQELR
jgi:hypothetical protein